MKQTTVRFLGIPVCSVRETEGGLIYYWWGGVWRKEVRQGEVKVYFLGLRVYWARVKISMPTDISNERIRNDVSKLFQIYSLAAHIHKDVFPKYRGCNEGKDIVLMASGPTLNYYTVLSGALHLGVNNSFAAGKARLDYHFVQDLDEKKYNGVEKFSNKNCKRFFGIHTLSWATIGDGCAEKYQAERYVFWDPRLFGCFWYLAPDISAMPLSSGTSVAIPAAWFALWTRPKRLFLVGCDVSSSGYASGCYAAGGGGKMLSSVCNSLFEEWSEVAKAARALYPDTEIISINPVGLKGLFHDVYTKSYLAAHPEIDPSTVEIIDK